MSDDITGHQPKTLAVPEAGRKYFGLGRNASYAAGSAETSRPSGLDDSSARRSLSWSGGLRKLVKLP